MSRLLPVVPALLCLLMGSATGCGTSAGGRVVDAEGDPAPGVHVAGVLVWDATGRVTSPPAPVVTRTDARGTFTLPRLARGTYLVVALRRLDGSLTDEDAARLALEVAAGRHPGSCILGSDLLTCDGHGLVNTHAGSDIRLGTSPDEGRHVAGRLEGAFHPDRFLYEVVAYGGGVSRHVLPDDSGRFDAGWLPAGGGAGLRVIARPFGTCELYNDVVDPKQGEPDARVVALPFHDRVRLRIGGAPTYAFGDEPRLKLMRSGRLWCDLAVDGPEGHLQTLREGETEVLAYTAARRADGSVTLGGTDDEDVELSSGVQTISIAPGSVPEEVVLELARGNG